jgi:hypothetical protein
MNFNVMLSHWIVTLKILRMVEKNAFLAEEQVVKEQLYIWKV